MIQDREDNSNEPTVLPLVSRLEIIVAFIVVLVMACFAVRFFFPGGARFHEIQVGSSVLRVPTPGTAQLSATALDAVDAAAQATFIIRAKNNNEITYTISGVTDEVLTAEQVSELMTEARRKYSGVSHLLQEARATEEIFRRTGIRLDRVRFRQYEENGALIRTIKGDTTDNAYRQKLYVDNATVLFLFQGRLYSVHVVVSALLSPNSADPLKEAWKWHGEIIAANSGDA